MAHKIQLWQLPGGEIPSHPLSFRWKNVTVHAGSEQKKLEEMKKSEEKNRKTFRLSDDEAADLKKKAELCGLTETEFILGHFFLSYSYMRS